MNSEARINRIQEEYLFWKFSNLILVKLATIPRLIEYNVYYFGVSERVLPYISNKMKILLYLHEYKKIPADGGCKKTMLYSFILPDLKPLSSSYQILDSMLLKWFSQI